MTTAAPVSVVVPAYRSDATVGRCLESLRRQSWRSFETILVDSSPDGRTAEIVRRFPEVRYQPAPERLLPHAARNVGAALAVGELLVFTDPDVIARPDWLERLVATHSETGHLVVGALDCDGEGWFERGVHIAKFSAWLPGGSPRPVHMGPTANLLCPRSVFDSLGRFPGALMHGDVVFSERARAAGHVLWFEPRAVVAHRYVPGERALRERLRRGVQLGRLRAARLGTRRAAAVYLAASLLPVRLGHILALTTARCRRAGWMRALLVTLPVVLAAHSAALAGESWAYVRALVGRGARP